MIVGEKKKFIERGALILEDLGLHMTNRPSLQMWQIVLEVLEVLGRNAPAVLAALTVSS
jgi:hypothetical protein